MSNSINLKKGLNVPISGEADLRVSKSIVPGVIAVKPDDFKGFLPRLLVKEGDAVCAGSPILADKKNPDILVCSPVSGTVRQIVRGEKRKLLAVLVDADEDQKKVDFGARNAQSLQAEEVKEAILQSGLWPFIVQRPYGVLADPMLRPKAIFVSAFNSAPLAADADFCFGDDVAAIQAAVTALSKLTDGGVHVSLNEANCCGTPLHKLEGVVFHTFSGRHPAGNVGVQISHVAPIRKEETVWTVSLAGLAAIGKLFTKGVVDLKRKIAVTGPMAIEPAYVISYPGMAMKDIKPFYGNTDEQIRFISGDVLSGTSVGEDGYLGWFDNQVTLIREGYDKELFGWIRPIRYKQFSTDHTYFSWLTPRRKYDMTTNLHGGPRAFLMNDAYYAKVLPMDIYPLYLTKACLAGDIEKMEKFGIYEVLPEDLATCEFVDPSKNNIQDMIAKGIDLMLKEMA